MHVRSKSAAETGAPGYSLEVERPGAVAPTKEAWREIAEGVREEFSAVLTAALLDVHETVRQANPHDHDYAGLAHRLQHAQSAAERSAVVSWLVGHTAQLVGSSEARASANANHYGGRLGHVIFSRICSGYLVPMLRGLIEKFIGMSAALSADEKLASARNFLPELLRIAGNVRGMIAALTATDRPEFFGAFRGAHEMVMIDPLEKDDYRRWDRFMRQRIGDTVAAAAPVEELRAMLDSKPEGGHCAFTHAGHTVWFVNIRRTPDGGYSGDGVFGGTAFDPSMAKYQFDWSFTAEGSVRLGPLFCVHASLAHNSIEKDAAQDFVNLCNWQEGGSLGELRADLLSFVMKAFHSSFYVRGQAAIIEKFMEAMLACKGCKSVTEAQRNVQEPPLDQQELPLDQQALCHFERNGFIAEANLRVVKIDPA